MKIEDRYLKIVSVLGLITLLIAVASAFSGCQTLQPTQTERKIDAVIDSGILSDSHVVSITDKVQIKAVLVAAKTEISAEQSAVITAQKQEAAYKTWAFRGKVATGVGIFVGFIFLIGIVWHILRFLHIIG